MLARLEPALCLLVLLASLGVALEVGTGVSNLLTAQSSTLTGKAKCGPSSGRRYLTPRSKSSVFTSTSTSVIDSSLRSTLTLSTPSLVASASTSVTDSSLENESTISTNASSRQGSTDTNPSTGLTMTSRSPDDSSRASSGPERTSGTPSTPNISHSGSTFIELPPSSSQTESVEHTSAVSTGNGVQSSGASSIPVDTFISGTPTHTSGSSRGSTGGLPLTSATNSEASLPSLTPSGQASTDPVTSVGLTHTNSNEQTISGLSLQPASYTRETLISASSSRGSEATDGISSPVSGTSLHSSASQSSADQTITLDPSSHIPSPDTSSTIPGVTDVTLPVKTETTVTGGSDISASSIAQTIATGSSSTAASNVDETSVGPSGHEPTGTLIETRSQSSLELPSTLPTTTGTPITPTDEPDPTGTLSTPIETTEGVTQSTTPDLGETSGAETTGSGTAIETPPVSISAEVTSSISTIVDTVVTDTDSSSGPSTAQSTETSEPPIVTETSELPTTTESNPTEPTTTEPYTTKPTGTELSQEPPESQTTPDAQPNSSSETEVDNSTPSDSTEVPNTSEESTEPSSTAPDPELSSIVEWSSEPFLTTSDLEISSIAEWSSEPSTIAGITQTSLENPESWTQPPQTSNGVHIPSSTTAPPDPTTTDPRGVIVTGTDGATATYVPSQDPHYSGLHTTRTTTEDDGDSVTIFPFGWLWIPIGSLPLHLPKPPRWNPDPNVPHNPEDDDPDDPDDDPSQSVPSSSSAECTATDVPVCTRTISYVSQESGYTTTELGDCQTSFECATATPSTTTTTISTTIPWAAMVTWIGKDLADPGSRPVDEETIKYYSNLFDELGISGGSSQGNSPVCTDEKSGLEASCFNAFWPVFCGDVISNNNETTSRNVSSSDVSLSVKRELQTKVRAHKRSRRLMRQESCSGYLIQFDWGKKDTGQCTQTCQKAMEKLGQTCSPGDSSFIAKEGSLDFKCGTYNYTVIKEDEEPTTTTELPSSTGETTTAEETTTTEEATTTAGPENTEEATTTEVPPPETTEETPTTTSEVDPPDYTPMTPGTRSCWDVSNYPKHKDVNPKTQDEHAKDFAETEPPNGWKFKSGSVSHASRWDKKGVRYEYSVAWMGNCATDEKEQDMRWPLGQSDEYKEYTAYQIMRDNYLKCNNEGIGGAIQHGCLLYQFNAWLNPSSLAQQEEGVVNENGTAIQRTITVI